MQRSYTNQKNERRRICKVKKGGMEAGHCGFFAALSPLLPYKRATAADRQSLLAHRQSRCAVIERMLKQSFDWMQLFLGKRHFQPAAALAVFPYSASSTAISASISSGRVAQLVAKRTTQCVLSSRSQKENRIVCPIFSICSSVSTTNC